jgi:hypothetical protein
MSSQAVEQCDAHSAAVRYDVEPQYQRQAPHFSGVGSQESGATGVVIDAGAGAAAVGAVALPPIASARMQSTGSTVSILLVMSALLCADHNQVHRLGQGSDPRIY